MAETGWALTSLYHTVVNCRDLDESVAFYRLLGFEVLNDRRHVEWPDFVCGIFGLSQAKGRGVLMVLPTDRDGPMIDLIEWLEPRAEFPDPQRRATTVPRIIAFRTRGVHAALAALSAAGVAFTQGVFEPEAALGLVGSCCCWDPNGNLIELIELQPGVRHSRANEALGQGE
ncbi:MAG: VOC family protein [Alphaproteobacteria bacterium]|nr:VOC family protein [Alphaproteobacteria bacterium]MBU1515874.1 VOC family protein [Alphaproteobacteria bacterium]MBU2094096.1 VOC family protein [Alphaproteobacteria bacterium]MBU2151448.1 VOC family protein [Alphaproteobacteria bacterium]MBU2305276.1 VOC family protein [Alphaproteobacteria bacterium]